MNLPAPIRLEIYPPTGLGHGDGSGFVIAYGDNELALITCWHVVVGAEITGNPRAGGPHPVGSVAYLYGNHSDTPLTTVALYEGGLPEWTQAGTSSISIQGVPGVSPPPCFDAIRIRIPTTPALCALAIPRSQLSTNPLAANSQLTMRGYPIGSKSRWDRTATVLRSVPPGWTEVTPPPECGMSGGPAFDDAILQAICVGRRAAHPEIGIVHDIVNLIGCLL